jgi:hypothetical protein
MPGYSVFKSRSGRRGSNSRPLPWQGNALDLYSGGAETGAKASTYPQLPRGSTLLGRETTRITRRSTVTTKRENDGEGMEAPIGGSESGRSGQRPSVSASFSSHYPSQSQSVEREPSKLDVASSSLVYRSVRDSAAARRAERPEGGFRIASRRYAALEASTQMLLAPGRDVRCLHTAAAAQEVA